MSPQFTPPARHALAKDVVMNELRQVLLGNACQIVLSTGEDILAETYLGIGLDEFSIGHMPASCLERIAAIDLDRFYIARQVGIAYDFALQLGDPRTRTVFTVDDWNDLAIFVEGAARCTFGGEPTPLTNEDSALRRTLDMALARMNLSHGLALTIRQLSLLADIGETAVRTSLSADGIHTDGRPAQVSAEVAELWLRRRRGFVPTSASTVPLLLDEVTAAAAVIRERPFDMALLEIVDRQGLDAAALAQRANVDLVWIRSLMSGDRVVCDIEALSRLAASLEIDVPLFVGRAVEAIIGRQ